MKKNGLFWVLFFFMPIVAFTIIYNLIPSSISLVTFRLFVTYLGIVPIVWFFGFVSNKTSRISFITTWLFSLGIGICYIALPI
ncbi:MAG: hypothetical protein ACI35O_12160 [Bacillaceae bacterium]